MLEKTKKQIEAVRLLSGNALNVLLFGGARSGKSLIIVRQLVLRAIKEFSRHVILRKHFNHVKQSVWHDTLPKVLNICFPGLAEQSRFDKSDWFITFPNKSELWIGGLDDKERTEKILGKEYVSIFFNECSEMDYSSVLIAKTRLAQKTKLKNKFFFDCNPAKKSHWTYKLFEEFKDPISEKPVDPKDYASLLMNPRDNLKNIDDVYISGVLEKLPERLRSRFLDGLYGSDDQDIIRSEWIYPSEHIGEIAAKFTFIDPAFTEESVANDTSCESAIVTVGIDFNGVIHDLEVQSGLWSYADLKAKCVATHKRHSDTQDTYFGVEDVAAQKWLAQDLGKLGINCFAIKPDGDKIRRTISITDLLEQGRCRVNNPKLRDQLLGFPSEKLKDCVDSYVGCLTMVKMFGSERYIKTQIETDKFKGMDSHQAWFKLTNDYAKKQLAGEEDVEYFSEITGEEDPDFY